MIKSQSNIRIIAIHYNDSVRTNRFLKQVCQWGIPVFLADNSAANGNYNFANDWVKIYHFPDNPGYFGAAERIRTLESLPSDHCVLIANTDLEFGQDFFENLEQLLIKDKKSAVLAPLLFSSISKKNTNPLYLERPSPKKMARLEKIFRFYLTGALWQVLAYVKDHFVSKKDDGLSAGTSVYAVHGALLIFTPQYFEAGLDFSYPNFLYGEEIWVAENLRLRNMQSTFYPNLSVTHLEHGSIGVIPSKRVWEAHKKSNIYLFNEFFKI